MFSWFTENSTFPMITGAILVVILLGLAFTSREKVMLYIAVVVGILTAGTVICERLIVTDQEQVVDCVYDLADLVKSNNVEGVVSYVSPDKPKTVAAVRSEMPRYDFESCQILGINRFEPGQIDGHKSAEIEFIALARGGRTNANESIPVHRKINLTFVQNAQGKWKIVTYSHSDPRAGITP